MDDFNWYLKNGYFCGNQEKKNYDIGISILQTLPLGSLRSPFPPHQTKGGALYHPIRARGVQDAIYWHPAMRWVIDRIYKKLYPLFYATDNPGNFPHFCLCEQDPVKTAYDQVEERNLGLMLYGMDYSHPDNILPRFSGQ